MTRGRFITFEGIDGAGKSTHLAWFAEQLRDWLAPQGKTLVVTREPGGTPLGEKLREIVLHESMHLETEALLMFAARREHLEQVIEPALARGDWVLSDRFTDASFAYQGGGGGMALDKLDILERWVQRELQPDLTLLFDLPTETAGARLADAREPDKFEAAPRSYFERTRAEYLRRAAQFPQRFRILDANQTESDVQAQISTVLRVLIGAGHGR